MNSVQMGSLMQQMESMRAQATTMQSKTGNSLGQQQISAPGAQQADQGSFGDILAKSIDQVNGLQNASEAAADAFVRGENNNLAGVMITQQKARIATTAMIEVRNKLLESYREVMNMAV